MFDLGPDKLVIIAVVVMIFLGPKEIPAVVRTIRKWQRQVQSFRDTIKHEIGSVLEPPRGGAAGPRSPRESGTVAPRDDDIEL
jgi:Sec-independent protein translocase protein TatA